MGNRVLLAVATAVLAACPAFAKDFVIHAGRLIGVSAKSTAYARATLLAGFIGAREVNAGPT